jgi:hypothetical protein
MKTYLAFAIIVFVVLSKSNAQNNLSGLFEVNYNTYSHNSLKQFQQEFINDLSEVDLRVNDDYGANIGYTLGLQVDSINTQFFASYNTTAGKISYSDFSGIIRITQLLKAFSIGGEYQINLSNKESKNKFFFGARGFLNFTTFDLENYSVLNTYVISDLIEFRSIDLGLGIRAIYEIPISKFKLRFNLGYDYVLGGNFNLADSPDLPLENDEGDFVKPGWSGLRTGVGIVIPL